MVELPSYGPGRVGIDAVEPERLRDRLERMPTLRRELFTEDELAYSDQQWAPHLHLAARFAAKEAVVKALALDGFDPLDIEVLAGDPAPAIQLRGEAATRANDMGVRIEISLTHVASLALAIAHAVRDDRAATG